MAGNYLEFGVYANEGYIVQWSEQKITKNNIFTSTFGYDENSGKYYINGIKEDEFQANGTIGAPINNTEMAIGVNPEGDTEPDGGYTDMEVYGVRIYNRALSEEEVEINSKADERRFKEEEIIPVYTEEQLLKIGSGASVYVEEENKTYVYSKNAKYEYKNNIEMQSDYSTILNKIKAGEIFIKLNENYIKSNDNYYTHKSQYSIAENKYGYVKENLQLLLDGIDNTGNGHSNVATTWTDLSGNNRNGTLTNITAAEAWTSEGLVFDGVDDYVPIAEMNYSNITMEAVAAPSDVPTGRTHIISNIQSGGYALYCNTSYKYGFLVYLSEYSDYIQRPFYTGEPLNGWLGKDVKCSYSVSYDGKRFTSRANNGYEYLDKEGTIGTTNDNTYVILGSNPSGSIGTESWFKGTIYSARIYDRALTDEEQSVNYLNDKARYDL